MKYTITEINRENRTITIKCNDDADFPGCKDVGGELDTYRYNPPSPEEMQGEEGSSDVELIAECTELFRTRLTGIPDDQLSWADSVGGSDLDQALARVLVAAHSDAAFGLPAGLAQYHKELLTGEFDWPADFQLSCERRLHSLTGSAFGVQPHMTGRQTYKVAQIIACRYALIDVGPVEKKDAKMYYMDTHPGAQASDSEVQSTPSCDCGNPECKDGATLKCWKGI